MDAGDKLTPVELIGSSAVLGGQSGDELMLRGRYHAECIGADGKLKWTDDFDNLVVTSGKNLALEAILAGSITTAPVYMGLISNVSYSAIVAGDTMASHAGWLEAGAANAPTYTAPRKTAVFAAASSGTKALSATLSFTIGATPGTIKGCFMVFGTSASSTIDSTTGTLLSAGLFSGGDRAVINLDVVNVSYSLSL